MRRAFTWLLLAVLSFPLIAPVLLANTASRLPSCCRRTGKHHCAMVDTADRDGLPAGPSAQMSRSKCPLFPTVQVIPAYSKIILVRRAPRLGVPYLLNLTTARHDDHRARIAFHGSLRKRGPPPSLD
jgi:hypothetical protein